MGNYQLVATGFCNGKKNLAVLPLFAGQIMKDAHTVLFLAVTLIAQEIATAVALPIHQTISDADLLFGKNKHSFVF